MPPNQSWQDQVQARQQQLEPLVQRAVARARAGAAGRAPKITDAFFYGAVGIDPKHLVIWYIFASNAHKKEAQANGLQVALDRESRAALREASYPAAVIDSIHVSFASDEEIRAAGGWRAFFA